MRGTERAIAYPDEGFRTEGHHPRPFPHDWLSVAFVSDPGAWLGSEPFPERRFSGKIGRDQPESWPTLTPVAPGISIAAPVIWLAPSVSR